MSDSDEGVSWNVLSAFWTHRVCLAPRKTAIPLRYDSQPSDVDTSKRSKKGTEPGRADTAQSVVGFSVQFEHKTLSTQSRMSLVRRKGLALPAWVDAYSDSLIGWGLDAGKLVLRSGTQITLEMTSQPLKIRHSTSLRSSGFKLRSCAACDPKSGPACERDPFPTALCASAPEKYVGWLTRVTSTSLPPHTSSALPPRRLLSSALWLPCGEKCRAKRHGNDDRSAQTIYIFQLHDNGS